MQLDDQKNIAEKVERVKTEIRSKFVMSPLYCLQKHWHSCYIEEIVNIVDIEDIVQGIFLHWASPKKLKYVNPRLGESTLT